MTDPIADFITRIRNAQAARHLTVRVGGSVMKEELARILQEEGYIEGWSSSSEGPKKTLEVKLKYGADGTPVIEGLERVSRPGRRFYCSAKSVPRVLGGLGISVLSTSHGVMSGETARTRKVGGEVLCKVW